ncbi:MAG: NAD(P)/FAD-dependent oxidoreductase [Anaerolineae bacterium]|nr:NAD(P)/FAD-dependent oxidoreductase [Anaerolineae bacterium]
MSQPTYDVIVVGGGAAGMMAAGRAGECGARTLLLEKMPRLGTKVRITGKGRCNLTNIASREVFISHFGSQGRFLNNAFGRFFSEDLRALLERFGVPTKVERGGRVFPLSDQALDVVIALERYMRTNRVEIRLNTPARGLILRDNAIAGVRTDAGPIAGRAVILAAGGMSYPGTGSTGDAYPWLEALGHTIHPLRPALVPLETQEPWSHALAGLTLRNVRVTLLVNGQKRHSQFGEMLFTHFGVSGPIILSMSTLAVDALAEGCVQISIDLKPALRDEELDARLQRELDAHGRQAIKTIAKNLLPQRLIPPVLELAGIPPDKVAGQITAAERRRLAGVLRDLRLTVTGSRSFREAMVTAGGVDVNEVDPRTMESKLVKGLYIVGELLDVHADTGGYNLQAAFSTGYVAGGAAAERARAMAEG